jgi:hypothetical protein
MQPYYLSFALCETFVITCTELIKHHLLQKMKAYFNYSDRSCNGRVEKITVWTMASGGIHLDEVYVYIAYTAAIRLRLAPYLYKGRAPSELRSDRRTINVICHLCGIWYSNFTNATYAWYSGSRAIWLHPILSVRRPRHSLAMAIAYISAGHVSIL